MLSREKFTYDQRILFADLQRRLDCWHFSIRTVKPTDYRATSILTSPSVSGEVFGMKAIRVPYSGRTFHSPGIEEQLRSIPN